PSRHRGETGDGSGLEGALSRYWALAGGLAAFFLTGYLLAEAFDVGVLIDPELDGRVAGGALGVALLVADAFLPVPSSLVMISLGALYGVVIGAALALFGRVGMAVACFAAGRRGGPLVRRLVSSQDHARADRLLQRWGGLAIVFSRPVPLVAETIAILAGASRLSRSRFLAAAVAGSLPEAVVYAIAGATAASFQNAAAIWTSLLLVAGLFWILGRAIDKRALRSRLMFAATTRHSSPPGARGTGASREH
ncbi:MAG: TVP38/TMEM64 family protein, partial [Gaiellaceae bacterium]